MRARFAGARLPARSSRIYETSEISLKKPSRLVYTILESNSADEQHLKQRSPIIALMKKRSPPPESFLASNAILLAAG